MTRFSEAWAQVATQNHILKVATLALATTTALLGVALTKSALKPPLIIERACFSKVTPIALDSVTSEEMESFLKEALSIRFDSSVPVQSDFLSLEELKARDSEQSELAKRGMKQRVQINSVKQKGSSIEVDADRLISVGSLRSALIFPIAVEINTAMRTAGNPYGLVLIKTRPLTGIDGENTTTQAPQNGGPHEKR